MARVMIFDGASAKSQRVIASHGGPTNSEMFERALSLHKHGLELFSLNVADGERLLQGVALSDFDGIVITGSPLSVYKTRPEVTRQIELAREAFECGVPMYGSCWGLQLMTAALGGVVRLIREGGKLGSRGTLRLMRREARISSSQTSRRPSMRSVRTRTMWRHFRWGQLRSHPMA